MSNNQMPVVQPKASVPQQINAGEEGHDNSGLVKTIAIVVLSLVAVTFIGLFIWIYVKYDDASTDLEEKIDVAVAEAKYEQALEDEAEFEEREKNPLMTFSGPADYGQLTFSYPKTWSVYIASDASNGGDFKAYFNPVKVNPISNTEVNSLRLTIRDVDFESVVKEYQRYLEGRDSNLSVESVTIANDVTANKYFGTIPGTEFIGYIVIFKIRDKTVILQTDSIWFESDFNKLLETITFNA